MSFRLFRSNSHMQVQTVSLHLPVWYIFITSRFTRNVEFSTTKPHAAMFTLINSLSKKTTSWHSDWNNIIRLLDIDTWMISWLVCWQLLIGYCYINHMGPDQYNRSVRVIEKHNIIILPECVNSTSLSLCLCLHTEVSLCLCHSVYHHKWVDAQFFGADAQFFRVDAQFFAAGLLWPRNYAFCCCWTTFALKNMVLCHVYPLLSMCKLCLPLTEHVQTPYWACAEIIYIIYPVFDSFDW